MAFGNQIRATMGLDSTQFQRGLKGAESGISRLRGMLGGLGLTIGAGSLIALGRQAISMADSIDKGSQRAQISTKAFQELSFAAKESGASMEDVERALREINTRAARQPELFEKYGIAIRDAAGNARSADLILRDIADAIARTEDPSQRAAIAMELMGRSGQMLLPMLAGGSKALDEWAKAADKAGQIMDEKTVKQLAAAQDQIQRFTTAITIFMGTIISWAFRAFDALAKFDDLKFRTIGGLLGTGSTPFGGDTVGRERTQAFRERNYGTLAKDLFMGAIGREGPLAQRASTLDAMTTQGQNVRAAERQIAGFTGITASGDIAARQEQRLIELREKLDAEIAELKKLNSTLSQITVGGDDGQ